MPKPSTGARYYAGPFNEVVLVDTDGNPHAVKHGDAAPDHIDVSTLPPDWVEKPVAAEPKPEK